VVVGTVKQFATIPEKTNQQVLEEESQISVKPIDVLCVKGKGMNKHPCNRYFREIVSYHQPQYITAKKGDKKMIAVSIVRMIRANGGRFLSKLSQDELIDVGDKKAWKKQVKRYEKKCMCVKRSLNRRFRK